MAVVGPGSVPNQVDDIKPMLDGVTEYEFVTLHNPLPDDFAVRVAQDVPINMPFNIGKDTSGKVTQLTNTEQDARQVYGLDLKNPDFQGRRHIINDTVIKAGQTINLKGNEAQVAVRQLMQEILQREGHGRLLADPNLRHEVEERIIVGRGSIQELMDGNIRSARSQIDEAINQSNNNLPQGGSTYEPGDKPAFQGLNQADSGSPAAPVDPGVDDQSQRRPVGRPKKTDS